MIAVVVVAILAAIAYPSYERQITRTRRSEGMGALLNVAQALERCYTRFGRYDDADCDVGLPFATESSFYQVAAVGDVTAAAFTLSATPIGVQAADAQCGTLVLTSTGSRGSQGETDDANGCW
jgi:type IV pilus assembly protein PilE